MYKCDRSTLSALPCPRSTGGDFALRLHDPDLVGGAGGCAFTSVTANHRNETNDNRYPETRTTSRKNRVAVQPLRRRYDGKKQGSLGDWRLLRKSWSRQTLKLEELGRPKDDRSINVFHPDLPSIGVAKASLYLYLP
jgi:hypothetical protein